MARIPVRQRAKQNVLHNTEDRRVGANAESQSNNGDSSEGRRFAKLAKGVAAIGEDAVQPVADAVRAHLFFELFDAAEFDAGGALRFVLRHSGAEVFFLQHCEVGTDLEVQIGLHAARREEVLQEASDFRKERHLRHLLFAAKRDHGIDLRSAPRRDAACDCGDGEQEKNHCQIGVGIKV
jgi:hypothetical protein